MGLRNIRGGRYIREAEEDLGYSYGGVKYTNGGHKANPTRSAQIAARNAGALTNREARSMGLRNIRGGRYIREDEDMDLTAEEEEALMAALEEDLGYSYGGVKYTNGGYKANPSRSDQIRARNAGALTNREARSMGLRNIRGGRYINEDEEDLGY